MVLRGSSVAIALVTLLTSPVSTSAASRNHAGEIIRGGAWRFHADEDPCGYDPHRLMCSFESGMGRRRRLGRSSSRSTFQLSVSSEVIPHLGGLTVFVDPALQPKSDDWIGVYCIDDEENPLSDREYIDWISADHLVDGAAEIGPLANMRCSWQFRYFTTTKSDSYVRLAESTYVRMAQGKTEPLHVHAAATADPSEMRIMWVSGAVEGPRVDYGTNPDKLTRSATGSGSTYAASDMCHSPATDVAANMFRDPGIMYSAVMTDLEADRTYYYRVSGGVGTSASKIFKLRTPPAPGSQQGVASFFVYGDLGDWNIHATGALPVKRTATTMQLIRRDMDDPKTNYVAVLHDGDLSYAMGKTYLWDQFGALIEPVAAEIPYMVGIGNHEYCHTSGGENDPSGALGNGFHPPEGNYGDESKGECGVPANKRFLMPANGNQVFWWSVEMGLVHHTMISSEHDYTPGSPMYVWLVYDLERVDRTKTPWLFLHLHRPMYTSEKYKSDYKVSKFLSRHLEPLLAKYNVDAVFSGHYHAYELTCPVFADKCRTEPLASGHQKALAPVHIMVGSAGADIDDAEHYDVPWRVDAQLEYGYGRVHVHNASHAQFEFVRNRDEIVASSTWIISDHNWTVNATEPRSHVVEDDETGSGGEHTSALQASIAGRVQATAEALVAALVVTVHLVVCELFAK